MSEPTLDDLARQVERASLFTHSALGRNGARVRELESFVYGLIDALLAQGVVASDAVETAVKKVREELDASGDVPEPGVALRIDPPASEQAPPVEVDCAARMHVCQAVCCKLDFALTADEVEHGVLRWDLGRPYLIRHEGDGWCTHNERESGRCGVYEDRPRPCRAYSCAGDDRIWTDFDRMELNTEWIEENVAVREPRFLHAMLAETEASS